MAIIIFILILGLLVIIHEFGHFIIAKKTGVYVEEFAFGFPPKIVGKKIGETLYSLNLLPIGGFVKLFGEEYQELDKKGKGIARNAPANRAFVNKKPWQKTLIILGGIIMNVVLAVGIYYFLLGTNNFRSDPLPLFTKYDFRFGHEEGRVVIANVIKNSPAEKAGVDSEDTVLRFRPDLSASAAWIKITSAKQLITVIKNHRDKPVEIRLENVRSGEQKTVSITPRYDKTLKRAIIGANLLDAVILKYERPDEKILSGFMHSYNILTYNLKIIGDLVGDSFKTGSVEPVSQTLSGPIGIYSVVADVVNTSGRKLVNNVLNIVALLSLSLALMNVLPLPALDGGRLVFILYEWISGKPANKTVERYVNTFGFFLLIALAIFVSINDIIRIIR